MEWPVNDDDVPDAAKGNPDNLGWPPMRVLAFTTGAGAIFLAVVFLLTH